MTVIKITSLIFLIQFYENFLVVPGHCRYIDILLFPSLEFEKFFVFLFFRFFEIILQELYHFLRRTFQALHIKGYFCSDHMFGISIAWRGIAVRIMFWAAVA